MPRCAYSSGRIDEAPVRARAADGRLHDRRFCWPTTPCRWPRALALALCLLAKHAPLGRARRACRGLALRLPVDWLAARGALRAACTAIVHNMRYTETGSTGVSPCCCTADTGWRPCWRRCLSGRAGAGKARCWR
ncbi:MAG: hypothetical protein ACLS7Z_10195 [Christensenellales bacterium]